MQPKLRFKKFNETWGSIRFSDVYTFLGTNSLSRADLVEESDSENDILNLHYGDIHKKYKSFINLQKVNLPRVKQGKIKSKIDFCIDGDLIIVDASEDYADIGKAVELFNIGDKKVVSGLHTFLARPNRNKVANFFMAYQMQTLLVRRQICKYATGISVLGIAKKNLMNVELYLPRIEEQKVIAAFLSAVDQKITILEKQQQAWEEYKQGMMQKLFSGELRFKDDNGEDFPEWKEFTFNKCFSFLNTNSFSRSCLTDNCSSGVLNIHYGDIHSKLPRLCDLDSIELPYLKSDIFDALKLSKFFCIDGDLIIADASEDYADIGKAVELVNVGNKSVLAGLHTLLARPDQSLIMNGFSSYLLQNVAVRRQIQKFATGTSVLGISKSNLNKVHIQLPSLTEQKKMTTLLSRLDKKIGNINQQLAQMKTWKQGLLQQIFV